MICNLAKPGKFLKEFCDRDSLGFRGISSGIWTENCTILRYFGAKSWNFMDFECFFGFFSLFSAYQLHLDRSPLLFGVGRWDLNGKQMRLDIFVSCKKCLEKKCSKKFWSKQKKLNVDHKIDFFDRKFGNLKFGKQFSQFSEF